MLVIGADDPATRRAALHLSARGAALLVWGRDRHEVLVTAGLAAASGGTARVIEGLSPFLVGTALIEAATSVLARPTDALVAEASATDAAAIARSLQDLLGVGSLAAAIPAHPPGGARVFAEATCAAFEAFVAKAVSDAGPVSDTLGPS